jgi:hypothetical protein
MDRGYGQYCPVAKGAEVFAARWIPLIIRNLDLGCRPAIVLWAWCRLLEPEPLPERRVVVRFDLRDLPRQRFWTLLERPDAEVCVTHPGFDEDLVIVTDSRTLTQVHMGCLPLGQAIETGAWETQGPPSLARALMTWGGLSPFGRVVPACDDQATAGPAPPGR